MGCKEASLALGVLYYVISVPGFQMACQLLRECRLDFIITHLQRNTYCRQLRPTITGYIRFFQARAASKCGAYGLRAQEKGVRRVTCTSNFSLVG